MKTIAIQDELHLRDPRKLERSHQLQLPFQDKAGRKAQKLLERRLGVNLKGFIGRIQKLDAATRRMIIAHDAGQARAMLWRQVHDAWPNVTFMDIVVRRNTELEDWQAQALGKGIWGEAELTIAVCKLRKPKRKRA